MGRLIKSGKNNKDKSTNRSLVANSLNSNNNIDNDILLYRPIEHFLKWETSTSADIKREALPFYKTRFTI